MKKTVQTIFFVVLAAVLSGGGNFVLKRTSEKLGCDEKEIALSKVAMVGTGFCTNPYCGYGFDMYTYNATGCGKQNRILLLCNPGESYEQDYSKCFVFPSPEEKASFEFGCDVNQLSTKLFDQTSVGIEGCGKRATYIFVYQNWTWVMNATAEQLTSKENDR